MRSVIGLLAVLLLAAGAESTNAQSVVCDGQSAGGTGIVSYDASLRDYVYRASSSLGGTVTFYIGTDDPEVSHYSNWCVPSGWSHDIVPAPGTPALSDYNSFTPHGTVSLGPTGACLYAIRFSGGVLSTTPSDFGFDHAGLPHDVSWAVVNGGINTSTWSSAVGAGSGPVHGPSRCDANCQVEDGSHSLVTTVILEGRKDGFGTGDGVEPAYPSPELLNFISGTCPLGPVDDCHPGQADCEFDCAVTDRCFGHTFASKWDVCGCVTSAQLCFRVKALSGSDNDNISFREEGVGVWGMLVKTLRNYCQTDPTWDPGDDFECCVDLANLPKDGRGITNVLGLLLDGDLDVYISDDTEVDYLELTIVTCCSECCAAGDINGDGVPLTIGDFSYLSAFVQGGGPAPQPLCWADLNDDGYVDQGDIQIFQDYFTYGPSVFPEYPIRTTCLPDTVRGACCEDTACWVRSLTNCEARRGIYAGDGIDCDTTCHSCPGNLVQNWGFYAGASAGELPSPGHANDWQAAYGTPTVVIDEGCEDDVYLTLEGRKLSGEAIAQNLANPIQAGKIYELSVCMRVSATSTEPYVKLQALAFNGSLPSIGLHPEPTKDIAIIDFSGSIPACEGWTTFLFHRWRANYDFAGLAICVGNNELLSTSKADLDNVCLREVGDTIPCYELVTDDLGNPVPPFGVLDPDCPQMEDDVDILMGNVSDLYSLCGPIGLDTYYETCPDSCVSLGGTIPPELTAFIEDDSLNQYLVDSLGVDDTQLMEEMRTYLDSLELADPEPFPIDSITALGALNLVCDTNLSAGGTPPNDQSSPFSGYDIVFVHGLRMTPLTERLSHPEMDQLKWPLNRAAFYSGYWKEGATAYWQEHIERYLNTHIDDPATGAAHHTGGQIYTNRVLIVSHASIQRFYAGAHAVMEQIANAMLDGRGVINCDPGEVRPKKTFGDRGYIIISHSAGGPLSDIVLSVSNMTQHPPLSWMLGDVSFVSERCRLHIALQGAFGGSNFATLALMAAAGGIAVGSIIDPVMKFDVTQATSWLPNSQLMDLALTKHLWGLVIKTSPINVLDVVGGHPSAFGDEPTGYYEVNVFASLIIKHALHHGFDDGVLSVESQVSNTDARKEYPARYFPRIPLSQMILLGAAFPYPGPMKIAALLNTKLYDMGLHKDRAIQYYLDQKLDLVVADKLFDQSPPGGGWIPDPMQPYLTVLEYMFASAGSTPWLSPSGMVQPVLISRFPTISSYDALSRYPRHYSFLQSTDDHFKGAIGPMVDYPDYEGTYGNGAGTFRNCEESRVVTSDDVYSVCGVSNAVKDLQVEIRRGKSRTFRIKIPFFKPFTITLWFWKRHYHLLKDWDTKSQLDYVYAHVLKQ